MNKMDAAFRGDVLARESYASLRHILRYENNLEVVRCALKRAKQAGELRKARLLEKKVRRLEGISGT